MTTKAECVHFWKIAASAGGDSLGECKFCKEKRMFKNSIDMPDSFGRGTNSTLSYGRSEDTRVRHKEPK